MKPFIPVQCPFCDARAQCVAPHPGAILVAPCGQCQEMMLLFAGTTLPLDKDILLHASDAEQRKHLRETIVQQLARRIGDVVYSSSSQQDVPSTPTAEPAAPRLVPSVAPDQPTALISDAEVRDFLAIDLHQIDEKKHFDRIFGSP